MTRKVSEDVRGTIRTLADQGLTTREIEARLKGRASRSTIAALLKSAPEAEPAAAPPAAAEGGDLAWLEEELGQLRGRVRSARSGTLKAYTDAVRSAVDLAARMQKMRPPPEVDPSEDPRNIAARAELRQRLARLIEGEEASRAAAEALTTVLR